MVYRQCDFRESKSCAGDNVAAFPVRVKFLFKVEERSAALEEVQAVCGKVDKLTLYRSHLPPGICHRHQTEADSLRSACPEALDGARQ